MLRKLFGFGRKDRKIKKAIRKAEYLKPAGIFSTDNLFPEMYEEDQSRVLAKSFQKALPKPVSVGDSAQVTSAMDYNLKPNPYQYGCMPGAQLGWFAGQGFIGYQLCGMLAQNWLISKACLMPAEDAVRNGYKVTVNDGNEVDPQFLQELRDLDIKYELNRNLVEFLQMGRVFGIRIAMFLIETENPADYYAKPFNIDGVTPGSYKGISQIDPYWITPELDMDASSNPMSKHFYEPTWWRVNGMRIHRTHLIIYRTENLPDILKPTYIYGSISIPQKIYERVYASERTANEAPLLALTKRTDVVKVDMAAALANQVSFDTKAKQWAYNRDNYGIKWIGTTEDMNQFDTSLADLDAVIMTQYQLVAAASNVPATKLLGTTPKGFNSTGEYEEANYHEMLESLQTHGLTPLIQRHHLLVIKSDLSPTYGEIPTEVVWEPLDAMTAKEQAEVNKMNADTDAVLATAGAIDGFDIRQRIINDPTSGYNGLEGEPPTPEEPTDPNDEPESVEYEDG